MVELRDVLSGMRCPGNEQHPQHAPCQGADTLMSGFYTETLVDLIHEAYARHKQQQETPVAMALKRAEAFLDDVNRQLEVDTATTKGCPADPYVDPLAKAWQEHRQRFGNNGMWNAMVTTSLHPSDPQARSPEA